MPLTSAGIWILVFSLAATAVVFLARSIHIKVPDHPQCEQHSRMFLDLAHNLQTPLAVLRTKVDHIESKFLHDGQVQGLRQSVDAVTGFVHELLAFAQLEESLHRDQKALFSLSSCVQGICEDGAVVAGAHGIRLTISIAPDISFFGNERRIGEVVQNLLSNAIKYMGDGTVRAIRVSLEKKSDQCVLEVIDTGMGIPEAELPRIFERFYRGSSRTYGAVQGTGLGLSIVECIVKEHGGAITVTSELGKGSTFTVILPG